MHQILLKFSAVIELTTQIFYLLFGSKSTKKGQKEKRKKLLRNFCIKVAK